MLLSLEGKFVAYILRMYNLFKVSVSNYTLNKRIVVLLAHDYKRIKKNYVCFVHKQLMIVEVMVPVSV
jgi:hypothetical protein